MALLFALSGFAISALVRADYQAGLDAHQQGDFDKAYYEWIKVAVSKEGEAHPAVRAEAQYALGMLYWLGQGVQQDTTTAAVWLREAAELDHAGAQSKLGYLFLSGQGVPHNDFEALKWLQMAAYKNDADAQYNLGVMYRDGLGVDPAPGQSLYWFRQAADNGDPVSARIVEESEFVDPAFKQAPPAMAETNNDPATVLHEADGSPLADEEGSSPLADEEGRSPLADEEGRSPLADDNPLTSVAPEQPDAGVLAEGEAWIRQRDPEHYTIQVIALLRLEKLQTFIGQHEDWAPFAIYQQQYQGKPLYVLIQGDYSDAAQAREATQLFPPGFQRREELWIRRFVMVQGLLN